MKLNDKIVEMLAEIQQLETPIHRQMLDVEIAVLKENLLQLYRCTDNTKTQELIIRIMSEAGYPWFRLMVSTNSQSPIQSEICFPRELLFMEPANLYLH